MKIWVWIFGIILMFPGSIFCTEMPVSEETVECIDCHLSFQPGLVADWEKSRHAITTPAQAMQADGPARKVSSENVPENLKNTVVGCAECHLQRPEAHADTFEHNGYDVHIVVSSKDCATCHAAEVGQYAGNLMAYAYQNLAGNPLYRKLQRSIIGSTSYQAGRIHFAPADAGTKAESCYYCHGTVLKVAGSEVRDTDAAGELEFPIIEGWPNQGVGRVNLDGSLGACTPCHTRHAFSIEMARKPYTCKECHIGPDVPVYKIYSSSKHGNMFESKHAQWNFRAVPWTIGRDFTAPTCAGCHISLLTDAEGEVVVQRTHQINDRLPWRLFGLIYAHPYPREPDTSIIRNSAGQSLPTDFKGGYAKDFLISKAEQNDRAGQIRQICLQCHGTNWVRGFWERFENTVRETNQATFTGTQVMSNIWSAGLADAANPFDEYAERLWCDIWLFYANTVRFASAMGGGGDYGVFADGRYALSKSILSLSDWFNLRKTVSDRQENQ